MHKRIRSALLVVIFCAGLIVVLVPVSLAQTTPVPVVSVVDGDSLNVMIGGQRQRLILYGIDCPELDQDFGQEAYQFTDERAYKQNVRLEVMGKDKRGRTIAIVYLPDGTNLNQELVKRGLAWWSDKYAPNDRQLKDLQTAAKATQQGLWSQPEPLCRGSGAMGRKTFRQPSRSLNSNDEGIGYSLLPINITLVPT
jgi:micrococcal nuclease